jgi:superfamily II DNA/RNA helicase
MFDMGFEPQVLRIASSLRKDRQWCMFSATFPGNLEKFAKSFMLNPIEIIVGGKKGSISESISQHVEIVPEDKKFNQLLYYIGKYSDTGQILVFTNTQEKAEQLFGQLIQLE